MSKKGKNKGSKKELPPIDVVASTSTDLEDIEPDYTTIASTSSSTLKSIRGAESVVLNVFSNPKYSKKYPDFAPSVESTSYDSRSLSENMKKRREDSPIDYKKSEEIYRLSQTDSENVRSLGKISTTSTLKKTQEITDLMSDVNLSRLDSESGTKNSQDSKHSMRSLTKKNTCEILLNVSNFSNTSVLDPNKWPKNFIDFHNKSSLQSSSEKVYLDKESEESSEKSYRKRNLFAFYENEKDQKKNLNDSETELAEMKSDVYLEDDVPPEKDREVKTYYQQLYFYVIFLAIVTSIAINMVSPNMYYLTRLVEDLFVDTPNIRQQVMHLGIYDPGKTLRNSRTYNDFWVFAESTMLEMFYWDYFYSDKDPVIHTKKDDRKMIYENQLLGVPRLRQVRVRNDSCKVYPNVKRFFNTCYGHYSVFNEETRPIYYDMMSSITSSAWVYTEAEDLNTSEYWGDINVYGGGGYYLDLSLEKDTAMAQIMHLKQFLWLYRGTRAIFLDFTIYNSNANLFCIVKLVFEFPPVGGMLPFPDIHTLKLIRYVSVKDFFILGCEIIMALYTVYFTYYLIHTIKSQLVLFFFNLWNYMDLVILLLLYIEIPLNVNLFIKNSEIIRSLPDRLERYTEFDQAKSRQITFNNVVALLTFCCWLKLFKFLNFSVHLLEYKKTLIRSLKDIFGFIPIFLTIFIAFAILANLLFCNQVKEYRTVWLSFLALLQAFLGEFEYGPIEAANAIFAPIFYIFFVFFIFFVLLNVFVAIIIDAYSTVKSEVIVDKPLTGKYFKRAFLNLSRCLCCNLGKKFQSKSSDKKLLIINELEEVLKRAGFTDDEIKIFFAKYNIDINSMLDAGTRRKIIEELELNRTQISERTHEVQIFSINRRIDSLNQRIKEIEISLQPIIDKLDVLLNRLR